MSRTAPADLTPPSHGGRNDLSPVHASYRAASYPGGEAAPPSSNTGEKVQSAALVDYLSVSIALSAFRDPQGPEQFALPRNENDLGAAIGSFRFRALAQTLFNSAFPMTAIEAKPFQKKGFLGYVYSSALHVDGVEGQVGMMGVGGNGNTVHISLTGAGCAWIRDWLRVRLSLEGIGATITRVDMAFDDLHGKHLDVLALADAARLGMFDSKRGAPSARRLMNDLGTGKGSTLYIGRKGGKELCIYDKGKALGDPASKWVRAEVRLWSKNRVIPWDCLTDPGAFVRGEYPFLGELLPKASASRSKVTKAHAEATIEAVERWLRHAAGKSLNFVRRAADANNAHPVEVLIDLSRDGMPRRFAGIPEQVAFSRTKIKGPPDENFHFKCESDEEIRYFEEGHTV